MKKFAIAVAMLVFVGLNSSEAFAIKQFKDAFGKKYAGEKASDEFKKLVKDASCNVCHVKGEKKKVRNAYGEEFHEILEKEKFPLKEFKKDSKNEKYLKQLDDFMKAIEKKEGGDPKLKTFGARMEAGKLPGGDKEGKKDW